MQCAIGSLVIPETRHPPSLKWLLDHQNYPLSHHSPAHEARLPHGMAAPVRLAPIGPIQSPDGGTSVADSLGIVAQSHGRICVLGDLGHQPDLDALRLEDRDEGMAGRARGDVWQAKAIERRHPVALAEILIKERTAASDPWLRLFRQPAGGRETRDAAPCPFAGSGCAMREASRAARRTSERLGVALLVECSTTALPGLGLSIFSIPLRVGGAGARSTGARPLRQLRIELAMLARSRS